MNTRIKPIFLICINLAFAWNFGLLPVFAFTAAVLLLAKYFPSRWWWVLPALALIAQRWPDQSMIIGIGGSVMLMQLWSALRSPTVLFQSGLISTTWFASMLAGPIQRDPKMAKTVCFNLRQNPSVYLLVAAGFLKCSAGVFLAQHITRIENIVALGSAPTVLVAALLNMLLFYCQLSGMTDLAIGASRFFGIELPANFDEPLRARDLPDFWRRWHITLNQWFFYEVYLPLSLSLQRYSLKLSKALTVGILFFTALLVGLWHGFNGPLLIWGLVNGIFLVIFSLWKGRGATLLSWVVILFLFLIMRLESFASVKLVLTRLVHFRSMDIERVLPSILILCVGLVTVIFISKSRSWQLKAWPLFLFLYLLGGFLLGRPSGQVLYPGF